MYQKKMAIKAKNHKEKMLGGIIRKKEVIETTEIIIKTILKILNKNLNIKYQ